MAIKMVLVSLLCFLVNIPLGKMRERSKKFSLAWLFWVHASIPLIVVLRIGLHLHWIAIPVNIASAIVGQTLGGLPEKRKRKALSPSASTTP